MFYRPMRGAGVLFLLNLFWVFPGVGQTASSPETLSVNARLVVLDVSVTDAAGHPVPNLTAQDFQVFEDGKLQRIHSFEAASAHALPPVAMAQGVSAKFDPAQPAAFGVSPVTILVLDQLNTHFADSSFARRSLEQYLAAQPALLAAPTTLLRVADNRFQSLEPFTLDRKALERALAAAPAEYAWKLETYGKAEYGPIERLDQTLRVLEDIAQSFAAIPGRKNLVWVGGGFPTLDPTTIDRGDAQEVRDTLAHITDLLLETRITLYAVDPTSSAAGMTEITDSTQLAFAEAAGDALSGNFDPFNSAEDFDRLGPVTGGRVVRGRNDVAQQIAKAVSLGNNFYTLSYIPTSAGDAAARYRRIRVVCTRPGLTAITRAGYFGGQTQQEGSAQTAAYDLTTAAESAIPLNGLRVAVMPGGAASSYDVQVAASSLTWTPRADGSSAASVYIMAVSLNAKGKMLAHTLHGMTASARAGTDLHASGKMAGFSFPVAPAAGAVTLRFIVRDSASGRMGSVDLSLRQ